MAAQSYSFVSVADMKSMLDISESTWDSILEDLIDQCTKFIMNFCGGRTFLGTGSDATEYYDGTDQNKLFLKNFPIISVTSISYRSGGTYATPTWTAFDADNDYIRDDVKGIIFFGPMPRGRQNIQVVYKAGYADAASVPDDLHLAVRKLVAKEFGRRKSQGALNESLGGASIQWNEKMDDGVKDILDSYKILV